MKTLRLQAHAKINLNLKVKGRRNDGYHEIESVVQSVALHDTLDFELAGERLRVEVDDAAVPAGKDNLVWKAADRLLRHPGAGPGLTIRVAKRIPAGAGLGGGSSDAAATLLGVNALLGRGDDPRALQSHAEALGSDVPYFLVGGTAVISGRGTAVASLSDLPPAALLLVHPGEPLETSRVYAQLQEPLTLAPGAASISSFGRMASDVACWVRYGNDLQPAATALCPAIQRVIEVLRSAGATEAAMSGSGSVVFGLFDGEVSLRAAAVAVEREGFRTITTETLDRASFRRNQGLS